MMGGNNSKRWGGGVGVEGGGGDGTALHTLTLS